MAFNQNTSNRPPLTIAILGGTRFIGFHLAETLLKNRNYVAIFHRGQTLEPAPFSGPVERFLGDRNEPDSLAPVFRRDYDAVIDLSGYTPAHVRPILQRWRHRIGHYIFCSSTLAYAHPLPSPFDENIPRSSSVGTYGGDKAKAEDEILRHGACHGWPVTIFRPQGVFGPFDAPHALHVVRRLKAKEPVLIRPKTIGKKINFLYIQDLVNYIIRSIGQPQAFGQAYNAAGKDPVTPESFGRLLTRISGAGPFKTLPLDTRLAGRFLDLGLHWVEYDAVANQAKLTNAFGDLWTPMEEGLRQTWEWWLTQPGLLDLNRQRWERQARFGLKPGRWHELTWRLYDSPPVEALRKTARRFLR